MLLTAATLQLLTAVQRALFGQNAATSAFMSAVSKQLLPALSTQADPLGPPVPGAFRFAAAESSHPLLSRAVVECVQSLRAGLGPGVRPHVLQLLVDGEKYGNHIELAPQFLLECLQTRGVSEKPAIFGGAALEVVGCSEQHPSIAIMAAHIPGVEVHTFHAKDASLPPLPEGAWDRLLRAGLPSKMQPAASDAIAHHSSGFVAGSSSSSSSSRLDQMSGAASAIAASDGTQSAPANAAAFLLAEPRFSEAGALAQRLQAALPAAPLLGGVLRDAAWGQRSLRGALFHGEHTHDSGAVGCIMQGPLQVDQVVVRGWQEALDPFSGGPRSRTRPSLQRQMRQLANHGSQEEEARTALHEQLQRYAAALTATGRADASAMGAFSYSSGMTDHEEQSAIAAALPGTPMLGAKCDTPFSGVDITAEGKLWPASATACAILRCAAPLTAGGGSFVQEEG